MLLLHLTESDEVTVVGASDNDNSHVKLWTSPTHQQYMDSPGVHSTHGIHKWNHR